MTNIAQHFRDCHSQTHSQEVSDPGPSGSPLVLRVEVGGGGGEGGGSRDPNLSVNEESKGCALPNKQQSVIKSVPHALVTLSAARWSRPRSRAAPVVFSFGFRFPFWSCRLHTLLQLGLGVTPLNQYLPHPGNQNFEESPPPIPPTTPPKKRNHKTNLALRNQGFSS